MVKRISIKETRAPYTIPVSEDDLAEGPIILERNGDAVAVLVPVQEYQRFIAWQEQQERKARHRARLEALERERLAFLRLKPELLRTHKGLYVAIHDDQIVDSDKDKRELAKRVFAQSYRPVYIELVSEEARTAEFPSPEVVVRDA
ncbi:MAG: DUF5678 domain-containing protein [Anaerolineae bacterium]|jgi:PHD/YefM family antitoxin component YafN of YafNO toxin-antitoxin module